MTESAIHFLLLGALLGGSAGISPGPLLTLVLTQTIKHNKREGIKVALSPLITDAPIILLTLFIFSQLAEIDLVMGIIAFIGAGYVAYLGWECVSTKELNVEVGEAKAGSIKKGIIANFLSPNPYLFWGSVGTPIFYQALDASVLSAVLFLGSFYLLLIGSKIMIAFVVAKTKNFINQNIYQWIMRILGLTLFCFAILLVIDGFGYF